MQKLSNIKWRSSDIEKLSRTVANFNRKINRALKKDPAAAAYLPNKIKIKDLRQQITSRKDFNREVKSLARFSRKGAEMPVVAKTGNVQTVWMKREIGIKVNNIINAQRRAMKAHFGAMDVFSEGQNQGVKRSQTQSERMKEFEPKPYNFNNIKPGTEWEKFVESVEKQAKSSYDNAKHELYRENYVKSLDKVFGDDAAAIVDAVNAMDIDLFMEKYFSNQDVTIEFNYDLNQDYDYKLELLGDVWLGE